MVLVSVRVSIRWNIQVRIIQRRSIYSATFTKAYSGCNKTTGIVGNNPGLGAKALWPPLGTRKLRRSGEQNPEKGCLTLVTSLWDSYFRPVDYKSGGSCNSHSAPYFLLHFYSKGYSSETAKRCTGSGGLRATMPSLSAPPPSTSTGSPIWKLP